MTGAFCTGGTGFPSELDEDDESSALSEEVVSFDFSEEELAVFTEEEELFDFTEEELAVFAEEDEEFSDLTEEEDFSDFTDEELFSVDSFFLDEELFSLPLEACLSLSFVAVHTTRVESPQVILTPAFPEVLTVSFTWQVPCSVSSSWMVSTESPLQIMSKPSVDSFTVQPESLWSFCSWGVTSAVLDESFFAALVEESSPQATR